jgi:hypothetical protein
MLSVSMCLHVHVSACLCRCLNADPNYGTSWFYFRDRPLDTPGTIIDAAHSVLNHELTLAEPVYVRAMVHYIVSVIDKRSPSTGSSSSSSSSMAAADSSSSSSFDFSAWLMDWSSVHPDSLHQALCSAPLLSVDGQATFSCQDFITGTVQLSRVLCATGRDASLDERREMLYGSDQITP